jgi:hypothetical protein
MKYYISFPILLCLAFTACKKDAQQKKCNLVSRVQNADNGYYYTAAYDGDGALKSVAINGSSTTYTVSYNSTKDTIRLDNKDDRYTYALNEARLVVWEEWYIKTSKRSIQTRHLYNNNTNQFVTDIIVNVSTNNVPSPSEGDMYT